MVALEAKYHTKQVLGGLAYIIEHKKPRLYKRCKDTNVMEVMSRIVFTELLATLKKLCHHDVEGVVIFKLSDLVPLYTTHVNGAT